MGRALCRKDEALRGYQRVIHGALLATTSTFQQQSRGDYRCNDCRLRNGVESAARWVEGNAQEVLGILFAKLGEVFPDHLQARDIAQSFLCRVSRIFQELLGDPQRAVLAVEA